MTRKAVVNWLFLACLLVSCGNSSVLPAQSPSATAVPATNLQSPTPADTFVVDIWVDKPEPTAGDLVIVVGMVTRNGVAVNGILMQASWPDPEKPGSKVDCRVLMTYARGICVIEASKYPVGQYVPIQILFDYRGTEITGETGFTRK